LKLKTSNSLLLPHSTAAGARGKVSSITMTPGDWKLVALALVSIGVLVLLVTRLKVNAFISLAAAALVVGTGSVFWLGVPARTATGAILKAADGSPTPYSMLNVVESFSAGLGGALGGVTAMVVLGTMLGKLLAESGGAEVLAQRFIDFFGPRRIQLCIMALALTIGLTTWFAVGLVLLAPIVLTLTHRTKQPFLLLFLPLLSCLSVMHGVMPPHPGPVIAAKELAVDMGRVLFWGFIIGIPTAAVAGPIYARFIVQRVHTEAPAVPDRSRSLEPGRSLPGFGITMFTIILPVGLMLISTAAELLLPKGDHLRESLSFIGGPFMALLIAVVFASWSLGLRCGYTGPQVLKFTEVAVASIGMTLVVIGAGGGFARVLRDSGVAESIGHFGASAKLSPLLFGWVISAFIRVATGSATVAITTASLLLPDYLKSQGITLDADHRCLVVVAIGCGSLFLSHLNDAGFWIVKECLGLSVPQTLRTWTVCETIVGIAGMLFSLLAYSLL
jgi:GntP family gluconate:H+ symporter